MINHAQLPAINGATLPQKYEAAKYALSECVKVDECKDWADKAAALASYAKQSKDEEMEKTAMRIRARAVRRCGELLSEIDAKHTGRIRGDAPPNSSTRKSAASVAGLSPDQAKDAIRVAQVPQDSFESQVESDTPPTVTKLAEQGTKKAKPIYEQLGMTKKCFQAGMYFRGDVECYLKATEKYAILDIVAGCTPAEKKELRRQLKEIEKFNRKLESEL